MTNPVYILSYARTPIGSFQGGLSSIPATELCSVAVKEAIRRSGVEDFDEIIIGNVLSTNLGQNPSKRVARLAGLPSSIPSSTVEKVCSSGMKSIMIAADAIASGRLSKVIAAGMESMSLVPWAIDSSVRKDGMRFGMKDCRIFDILKEDGLQDEETGMGMGECAEMSAEKYSLSREEIDSYAIKSYERSILSKDHLKKEIVAMPSWILEDEEISRFKREKMSLLRSPFKMDGGVITAGNASPMSDGASAIILSGPSDTGPKPRGRLVAWADASQTGKDFPSTPCIAIRKVLKEAKMFIDDIDKFEINEAFAIVPLIAMKELGIPEEKVNVWGGAVSLGHPLGSSGNRICGTLLNQLETFSERYGLAVICNGGGGASAIIIENLVGFD